jgi:hypothetical protein
MNGTPRQENLSLTQRIPISPAFRDHIDAALRDGEHLNVRPARVIGKESGV